MKRQTTPRHSVLRALRTAACCALGLFAYGALVMPPVSVAIAATAAGPSGGSAATTGTPVQVDQTPLTVQPAIPPNITLMLDDSGSMAWDYMPDWDYLPDTSRVARNGVWDYDGVRDSALNGLYYNPATTYTPPPQANGSAYPNSPGLTTAYSDGFTNPTGVNITTYTGGGNGNSFRYGDNLPTTQFTAGKDYPAVWGGASTGGCASPYYVDPNDSSQCIRDPVAQHEVYQCNSGDPGPNTYNGIPNMCRHTDWEEGTAVYTYYPATDEGLQCPSGGTLESDGLCHFSPKPVTQPTSAYWTCPNGGSTDTSAPPPPSAAPECTSSGSRIKVWVFTYVTGSQGSYTQHYVAPGTGCDNLYDASQKANCVDEDDTTGIAAPNGVAAGQNIANWFSYYRTRMLMAKSGLMTAFNTLDPNFRVGFGSINGGAGANNNVQYFPSTSSSVFSYTDAFNGGTNLIDDVAPFDTNCATNPTTCTPGQSGTQRAAFWNWIAKAQPGHETPLRQALDAAGQYYQSSQPWGWMSTDPGYANRGNADDIACRQSNTILTTDGFWNGNYSSTTTAGASDTKGPTVHDPDPAAASSTVVTYTPAAPFSGGATDDGTPSLADVAMYYWDHDLQTGDANEVPTDTADPAFWQHMVTFTLGMGFAPQNITGTAANGDSPPTTQDIFNWVAGGTITWPTPSRKDASGENNGSVNNIADLEHAGLNGHGGFFQANNPQTFVAGIESALKRAGDRLATGASLGANSTKLDTGTFVYQAQYFTGSWRGDLLGIELNQATGDPACSPPTSPCWSAATALNGQASVSGNDRTYPQVTSTAILTSSSTNPAFGRNVETYNTVTGAFVPFVNGTGSTPPALASDQLASLGSDAAAQAKMVNYLRGDNTDEKSNGGDLRTRTTPFGDIVDSAPLYTAAPDTTEFNGESFPGLALFTDSSGTYSPFQRWAQGTIDSSTGKLTPSAASQRAGMIYAAGNDGMLHVLDASTGKEVFAYLPGALLVNQTDPVTGQAEPLVNLADPAYGSAAMPHQDYNDGQLTVADAYVKLSQTGDTNPQWHTILVGTTGKGPARAVYALDVTDPTNIKPLWERYAGDKSTLDSNSGYIGQMTGAPVIAQTSVSTDSSGNSTGTWSALIGNGYNSPNGVAALLQFNLATGQLHVHTTNTTTSNGLAPVYTWMSNSSTGVTDLAYAGDLTGHVWQFNLDKTTCTGTGNNVTCTTAASPDSAGTSIFTAIAPDGTTAQPITGGMLVAQNPTDSGLWLFFGTGKYINQGDVSSKAVQTWYGLIVTPGSNNAAPTNLTGRSVLAQRSIIYEDTGVDNGYPARAVTPLPSTPDICNVATSTGNGNGGGSSGSSTSCKMGWYMDLVSPVNDTSGATPPASTLAQGERMVVPNQLQGGLLVGTSIIPQPKDQPINPCLPAGEGWIMALDPFTGTNPPKDFFDRNKDGTIGGGDGVTQNGNNVPAAGIRLGSLPNAPIFVGGHAIVSLANGSLANVATRGGNGVYQRVSWRELVNP